MKLSNADLKRLEAHLKAILEALSKNIALTSDAWKVPGIACRHPGKDLETERLRRLAKGWVWEVDPIYYEDGRESPGVLETIATGPDLLDGITVNALLEDRTVDCRYRWVDGASEKYWWCGPINELGYGVVEPTRTEAVATAWLAVHKAPAAPP